MASGEVSLKPSEARGAGRSGGSPHGPATIGGIATSGGSDLPPARLPTVDLKRVTENLNRYLTSNQRQLRFSVDEATGRTVITVINPATGEIVRRIPPEAVRALAAALPPSGGVLHELI